MIPVKGHPNLYRDETTGAIVNCDVHSYNQYVNSLNNRESQKNELIVYIFITLHEFLLVVVRMCEYKYTRLHNYMILFK